MNKEGEEILTSIQQRLRDHQHKLFALAKKRNITKDERQAAFEEVCETVADLVHCDRVGIWEFDKETPSLVCQNLFESKINRHSGGITLEKDVFPTYFSLLQENRVIAIRDVSTDLRVHELYPDYFREAGEIKSMLDAPILLSEGVIGVLCCETSEQRDWTELEETLVATLADSIAFIMEGIKRQEIEKRVENLAFYDQVTHLPNLSFLLSEMEQLSSYPAVVCIQLDQFTKINDALGYDGGDAILKEIADRLLAVREEDELIGRVGNDYFALALPKGTTRMEVEERANVFFTRLSEPYYPLGYEVLASFSAGFAKVNGEAATPKQLIQAAHMALSREKRRSSRNIRTWFEETMKASSIQELEVEMDLRKALDLKQFSLHYQPKLDVIQNKVIGVEALIRWNHPEIGMISPQLFIPLAESTGIILPIGDWVIEESCRKLSSMQKEGRKGLTMSINVSPRQFLHEQFTEKVKNTVDRYKLKPELICLEITESVAMEDKELVLARLMELHHAGFQLSIDDFGTGFSAFVYLRDYPINEIKIDRAFIKEIEQVDKSVAIVKTILDLASGLGLRVVVEGVETEGQLQLLKKHGCQYVQGFLFSTPLSGPDLDLWLKNRDRYV